jgi:hypothetical protein
MAYSQKIKKKEYGLKSFYEKRFKYYLYGAGLGAGLLSYGFLTRQPYTVIEGMVLTGGTALAYVGDYSRQIGKNFVGKKIYTFKDGTKILADTEKDAIAVYNKHKHHKKHPAHYKLLHTGEHKIKWHLK